MPEETVMETARRDAPNAHDVLFGDAAEETAAVVADDADAKEDDAKDANGEGDEDAEDAAEAEDKPDSEEEPGAAEELKVVVSIKGDRATIGVKGTSSDPHIESFDDQDLFGLAQELPAVVERARARWEDAPKHPAHVKPAPPAKRQSRRGQGTVQAAAEGGAGQQQPEALRLF